MASSVLVTPILLLRLALGILPPACQPPTGFSRPVTRFDLLYARGPNKDLAAAEQACNNDFPGSEMVLFDDVKEIELIWSRKYRTYTRRANLPGVGFVLGEHGNIYIFTRNLDLYELHERAHGKTNRMQLIYSTFSLLMRFSVPGYFPGDWLWTGLIMPFGCSDASCVEYSNGSLVR